LGKTSKAGTALKTDEDFVMALLEATGVALVHGTAFGSPGSMRLSYAASNRELEDAVSRIQDFCAGVH
jgi:aspartate aminotransferase